MRNFAFILLLPCLCLTADGPAPVDAVIAMARAVPGEFAADASIRLASLNSLEKARRIQLLEQAFQRAAESQEPLKRQPAILKVPGSAGFLNRAFSQDLDALSLRLRAVAAMEALDATKARALFQQIPPLRLPKLTCADFMVYNVAGYYQMLARLAAPRLVLEQVAAITSPVQIVPAAKVVLAATTDGDFQAELAAFAAALGKISGDDRSFTFVRDPGPQILSLVEESKRRKISPLPLLENYRLYLVVNQQTARCADDDLMAPQTEQKFSLTSGTPVIGGEGVEFFNSKLRMPSIQPIQEQETTPTSLEGVAEGLRGCQDTSCQALARQYNDLIFDSETNTPYPTSRRTTPAWQAQVHKLLTALATSQRASANTPAQYYRQVSAIYADVLSLVPAGALREEVVHGMLAFAQKNDFKAQNHVEWFLPINILVGRMAMDPFGLGQSADQLRQSQDPIVALYSALESIAPRTPDQIMSLM